MRVQLITMCLEAGRGVDLPRLVEHLQSAEQADSSLIRSTAMFDQSDPTRAYMMVGFESEERVRARENDPRRQQGSQAARATMAGIFDGGPGFRGPHGHGRLLDVGTQR